MYWKSICDALKVSLALITSAPPTVLGGRDSGGERTKTKIKTSPQVKRHKMSLLSLYQLLWFLSLGKYYGQITFYDYITFYGY